MLFERALIPSKIDAFYDIAKDDKLCNTCVKPHIVIFPDCICSTISHGMATVKLYYLYQNSFRLLILELVISDALGS